MVEPLIIIAIIWLYYKSVMYLMVKNYRTDIILVIVLASLLLSPLGTFIIALLVPPREKEE